MEKKKIELPEFMKQSWSGKTGQVHKWINCSTVNPRRDIV